MSQTHPQQSYSLSQVSMYHNWWPSKSQKRLWNGLCVTVRESRIKSCRTNSWLMHTGSFNTDRLYHISCYKEQENETVATNKQQPFSRSTWISHSLPSVSFLHLFQNRKLWAQVARAFSRPNVVPVNWSHSFFTQRRMTDRKSVMSTCTGFVMPVS